MGRGKRLNPTEIQAILRLSEQRCSVTKIAKTVNRSRKVIANLLKDPDNYGRRKSCGRPRCLTARDKRAIIRVASNSALTARQIAKEAGIATNVRNVRRLLKNCEHLERRKLLQREHWPSQLKLCRLQFAERRVYMDKKRRRVIFADEKAYNLDGPRYYYHDLRKEQQLNRRARRDDAALK